MEFCKPIQTLLDEHDVIYSVLEATGAVARRSGDEFDQDFYRKAFDFFQAFAEKHHHAKEEAHFFPLVERRGALRKGGPIGVWLVEHEQGRQRIAAVHEALQRSADGDRKAQETVRAETLAYVKLIQRHIHKENVFYVTSELRMTAADKEELWRKFLATEEEVLPKPVREKYVALAAELRAAAGLPPFEGLSSSSLVSEEHGGSD